METFTTFLLLFCMGAIMGVLGKISKKITFFIWIVAIIYTIIGISFSPAEYTLNNFGGWWTFILGIVGYTFGEITGALAYKVAFKNG